MTKLDPDAICAICGLPRRGHWGRSPIAAGVCTGFQSERVLFYCIASDANGEDVSLMVAARDAEEARDLWRASAAENDWRAEPPKLRILRLPNPAGLARALPWEDLPETEIEV